MKHIKIYEEYTDDEIKDLIGDLDKVGHYKIPFVIEAPMSEKQKDMEEKAVEMWSFKSLGEELKVKSGKLISPSNERTILSLEITNGDKIILVKELGGFVFSINGEYPSQLQGDMRYSGSSFYPRDYTYSYAEDALGRYKNWLHFRNVPDPEIPAQKEKGLLRKIKSKFGIEESYSDDEIRELMGDLHKVGHSPLVFHLYFPEDPFGQKCQKEEEEYAENWKSEIDPKRHIIKVEGKIEEYTDDSWVEVTLDNKAFIEYHYHFDRRIGEFKINGKEYPEYAGEIQDGIIDYGKGYLEQMMTCYDKEIEKNYY